MAGPRPVAEIMLVDFLGSCLDALLNQAAKMCLEGTIPSARHLERAALPSAERIAAAVRSLCG